MVKNIVKDVKFLSLPSTDMTEDDIQLCILTRLQLSNRTIGNIYCISISAVQHRKLRIKKDVFGEMNPEMTLEQVIINS